jgi:hypothetical protein
LRRGRVFRLDWVQWGRQPLWGGSRYMRLRPAPAKVAPRGNDPAPQWSVEGGVSYLHSSRESEWSSASCWASILYLLGEHPQMCRCLVRGRACPHPGMGTTVAGSTPPENTQRGDVDDGPGTCIVPTRPGASFPPRSVGLVRVGSLGGGQNNPPPSTLPSAKNKERGPPWLRTKQGAGSILGGPERPNNKGGWSGNPRPPDVISEHTAAENYTSVTPRI